MAKESVAWRNKIKEIIIDEGKERDLKPDHMIVTKYKVKRNMNRQKIIKSTRK